MFGLRKTVDDATGKLADTASDTKTAMTALAVLGLAALAVSLVVLAVAMGRN